MRPIALCLLLSSLVVLDVMSQGRAATTGLAFDTVTRSNGAAMMGQGASTLEPAVSFDEAFELASQSRLPDSASLTNPLTAANAAKAMQAAQRNGQASRYYFLGSRERSDELFSQTSKITDCAAGTLTTLNHSAKTYRVEPLVPGAAPGSAGGKDDDVTMAVKMTTSPLPALTIENTLTQGYAADMQISMQKPGSSPTNMEMKAQLYFSNYAQPLLTCALAFAAGDRAGVGNFVAFALSNDKRVSSSVNGPPIPTDRLALWEVLEPVMSGSNIPSMPGGGPRNAIRFQTGTQRGHIRVISDGDAAFFSVPADYRQEK